MNLNISGLLFLLFVIISCNTGPIQLQYSTGSHGEIAVVVESSYWNGVLIETVESGLMVSLDGLPRPEPTFDLFVVDPLMFGKLYQTHRNILILNISDTIKSTKTTFKRNKWSYNQLIVTINANTYEGCIHEFKANSADLIDLFNKSENASYMSFDKRHGSVNPKEIVARHKYEINLKPGVILAKEAGSFVWYKWEQNMSKGGFDHQISQNLLTYYLPYTDTSVLALEKLIHIRDSVLKLYVPGSSSDSYLSTSFRLMPPFAKEFALNGKYAKSVNGLWRVEKGLNMGGPFVLIAQVDEKSNRMFIAEGFVYAPQFEKRELLRELESMIMTIVFK